MEFRRHFNSSDVGAPSGHVLPLPIRTALRGALAVDGAALLTWAGADVRVPLEPVPITLQTLFVLLAGALIGPGRGALSQVVYMSVGIAGVPLFAGAGTGMSVLSGPTGGYLLGFVIAPVIVGRWVERRADFSWRLLVFSVGALVILVLGVLHLALFYTGSFPAAVRLGLLPFIPGDIAKVFAAASIYTAYHRLRSQG